MSDLQCPATILLARHAEPKYETTAWSDAGGSLTATGRRQAADLAARMRSRSIAHLYASTMARSVQTAEIAANALGVGVTTREGLREFTVGDAAGRPLGGPNPFADVYSRWLGGDLSHRMPGGDSGNELVARFGEVLAEIADVHRGETVLAISHGGLLRLAVPVLCRMSVPATGLGFTATAEVSIDADGWICQAWDPPAPAATSR